jgi:hypothetical protein
MRHHNIVQGVNISASHLRSVILSQVLDSFENDQPGMLERIHFRFNLSGDKISDVLEHTNSDQVIVDVVTAVARIQVDRI